MKIEFKMITIEGNSEEELRVLVKVLKEHGVSLPDAKATTSATGQVTHGKPFNLTNRQSRLLKMLRNAAPHGVTDREIREELRFENNRQLAGSLGALARKLGNVFGKFPDGVFRGEDYRYNDEEWGYRYYLTPKLFELIETGSIILGG